MSRKQILLICCTVILLMLVGCDMSAKGPVTQPSSEVLSSAVGVYYPIGLTQQIKYDFRSRPFDTDVTLEGIGWQDGKLIAVLKAVVHAQKNIFTHAPKRLTPRVTYQGKTFPLNQLIWEEGSSETYKQSVYRYAVSAAEAKEIPEGSLPDSFAINEDTYKLPDRLPEAASLPAKQQLTAKVGSVAKVIDSGGLTYQVEEVLINGEQRVVKMMVNAAEESNETSGFIIRDDQWRIYTFEPTSLPRAYKPGKNEVELTLIQPIPADTKHLYLVLFEKELAQPGLDNVVGEVEIPLF